MLIIEQIVKGMGLSEISNIEIRNLNQIEKQEEWAKEFENIDNQLFVFPLYVHAMPGCVMNFFEKLAPVNKDKVHMAFLIQSGFPETSQSYYLRPYLELLTKRLGVSFDGIIIKGGVEGIHIKPEKANRKFFGQMQEVGIVYGKDGIMDTRLKKEYEKEEYLSKGVQILYRLFSFTGLTNFYWNYNLKQNGAYQSRFDRPYSKQ
jgi:hypothetical protein